jgi:hypothetical protein
VRTDLRFISRALPERNSKPAISDRGAQARIRGRSRRSGSVTMTCRRDVLLALVDFSRRIDCVRSPDSGTPSKTSPQRREEALSVAEWHPQRVCSRFPRAEASRGQPEGVEIAVTASTGWGHSTALRRSSRRMMNVIGSKHTPCCLGWRASERARRRREPLAALRLALGGPRSPRLRQLRAVHRAALRIQVTHHSGETARGRGARGTAPPGARSRSRRSELVRRARTYACGAPRDRVSLARRRSRQDPPRARDSRGEQGSR